MFDDLILALKCCGAGVFAFDNLLSPTAGERAKS
jgi:hypothetical protein